MAQGKNEIGGLKVEKKKESANEDKDDVGFENYENEDYQAEEYGEDDYDDRYADEADENKEDEKVEAVDFATMRLCRWYKEGTCTFTAATCRNLHGELPRVSDEHCRFFVTGGACRSSDDECRFKHDATYRA